MTQPLEELKAELRTIADLESAIAVLEWDQQTYMPSGGAEARGRQIALLGRLVHERRIAPRMSTLLAATGSLEGTESTDGALVRKARRDWERATRVPPELVSEIREHAAATFGIWSRARPQGDFEAVRPALEKMVELSRRWSDCFPERDHVGDPLVDAQDLGMSVGRVRDLFGALREGLVPIAQRLAEEPEPDVSFLQGTFPKNAQLAFGMRVASALGFDTERGRQDEAHHPFMIRFSAGDIRITTRVREDDPTEALFSTIHEAGHALYEQNIAGAFDGTPLGGGASTGVHESQSRLWENQVGRSRAFWEHFYPLLQETFPDLRGVELGAFHRAINRVRPSLIRTAADEVTYNLHIMLRFDLEMRLLDGSLKVADLPDAWNERMQSDLGVRPESAAEGCMQDIHWFCTTIGGTFQGYTLGNLMGAQFYRAASAHLPALDASIAAGELAPLRQWLSENIYQHGARYEPEALVERVTGAPLGIDAFLTYLREKYGALYGVRWNHD